MDFASPTVMETVNNPVATAKSIAVLPFLAMSDGPDDEYFADGLTEEILNSLAQLPELLITARTSSFHFKGQDIPVQEIAAALGVEHIVEGSVRRSGDRLRVTAQLIRSEDGFPLVSGGTRLVEPRRNRERQVQTVKSVAQVDGRGSIKVIRTVRVTESVVG